MRDGEEERQVRIGEQCGYDGSGQESVGDDGEGGPGTGKSAG